MSFATLHALDLADMLCNDYLSILQALLARAVDKINPSNN